MGSQRRETAGFISLKHTSVARFARQYERIVSKASMVYLFSAIIQELQCSYMQINNC